MLSRLSRQSWLLMVTTLTFSPNVVAAQSVDHTLCYFVPEAGSTTNPITGTAATAFFRACPNNDGGASLPNSARIKIFVRDVNNNPVVGVPPSLIYVLFNKGTAAQGFSGGGADSIIANGTWNVNPLCPDVSHLYADAPTSDPLGFTYITFSGANPAAPGVGVRDPNRKWGHYDSVLPVYLDAGFGGQILGRLTPDAPAGSYVLRVKNFDFLDGLQAGLNLGERVTATDFNSVLNNLNQNDALSYWRDFDSSGAVTTTDFNMINAHSGHRCDTPNNP